MVVETLHRGARRSAVCAGLGPDAQDRCGLRRRAVVDVRTVRVWVLEWPPRLLWSVSPSRMSRSANDSLSGRSSGRTSCRACLAASASPGVIARSVPIRPTSCAGFEALWEGRLPLPVGVRRAPKSFHPFERVFGGWADCVEQLGYARPRAKASGPDKSCRQRLRSFSDDELVAVAQAFGHFQAGPLRCRDFARWLADPRPAAGHELPPRTPATYERFRRQFGAFRNVLRAAGREHRVAASSARRREPPWDASCVDFLPPNIGEQASLVDRSVYWLDAATQARRKAPTESECRRLRDRWADLADVRDLPVPDAPHPNVMAGALGGWKRAIGGPAATEPAWRGATKDRGAAA
jgi:hypothetical protein